MSKMVTIEDIIVPITIKLNPATKKDCNISWDRISGTISLRELQDAVAYAMIYQAEEIHRLTREKENYNDIKK